MSKPRKFPFGGSRSGTTWLAGCTGTVVVVSALTLSSLTLSSVTSISAVSAQDNRVGVNPPVTFVVDPETTTTTSTTIDPFAVPTTIPMPAETTTLVPAPTVVADPSTSTTLPGAVAPVPGAGDPTASPATPALPAPTVPTVPGPVPVVGETSTSLAPVPVTGAPTIPGPTPTTLPKSKTPTTTAPARTVAELQQRIDALLAPIPGLSASIALDGIGPVYARNADRAAVPASTQKMYTIGAALLRLGGDHRYVTEVRSSALVESVTGILAGDLVVRASGDPSFSSASVNTLADSVLRSGVKVVTGDLVVDESHFDSRRTNDGWKASFTPGEVGSLSAFSVNGNHQGGRSLSDPALTNLALVRAALTKRGVKITGVDRRGVLPLGGPVLGSVTSAPLRDLASYAMKKSENTYAELMLKELGASAGNGSAAGGIEMVRQQFASFGVSSPVMADGSGLSSLNRSTTAQQVAWLGKLRASKAANDFRVSLPVACVDGTLKTRLCKTAGSGKVQAKTGTLDNVTALAGYASLRTGKVATFSFIGNGLSSTSRARTAIDQALIQVITSTIG